MAFSFRGMLCSSFGHEHDNNDDVENYKDDNDFSEQDKDTFKMNRISESWILSHWQIQSKRLIFLGHFWNQVRTHSLEQIPKH